jgi:hypothetical protein
VAALNRRLTDERDVDLACASRSSPTGSFTRAAGGRLPGEHPFHHDLRQQVIVG